VTVNPHVLLSVDGVALKKFLNAVFAAKVMVLRILFVPSTKTTIVCSVSGSGGLKKVTTRKELQVGGARKIRHCIEVADF
jgi:hypothetical protein